jgi:hypothetical protein
MDEAIVQEATQKRKLRALQILEAGLVSSNGVAHQYDVRSQSGNGRYLAATSTTCPPHGRCNCPDFEKNGEFFPCKHIQAADIYEAAETYALHLIETHGLHRVENELIRRLCAGLPELDAVRTTILFHAVQRIADEQAMWDAVDRRIEELKDAEQDALDVADHQMPVPEAMQ